MKEKQTLIKTFVCGAILSSLGMVVWGMRDEVGTALARADWRMAAAAVGVCLAYRLLNASVWGVVLAALGQRAGLVTSARIWLQTEALRWIPGGIWGYCSRVVEATRQGIPKGAAALSLPLELGVTIAAWAVTATVGLALAGMPARYGAMLPELPWWSFGAGMAACLLILCVLSFSKVRRRLAASISRRFEALGALAGARPRLGKSCKAFGLYTGLCFVQGVGFYLALQALWPEAAISPAAAIGVNAAAWLAGFFAIGAPGGLGAREAGLCALLLPLLPLEQAALAAVFWRVLQIAVELLSLGVALLLAPARIETITSVCYEETA